MKKLVILAVIGMAVSMTAGAFTVNPAYDAAVPGGYDYATVQNFGIGNSSSPELLGIYNQIAASLGGVQATDWADLMSRSADPDSYSNGEPGGFGPGGPQDLFNGKHDVTFEARYASAEHRLYAVDDDGDQAQLTGLPVQSWVDPALGLPIGTVAPGQGAFSAIGNPWDLRLDFHKGSENHSLSTDRLVNLGNGYTGYNNGVYALIFSIAGVPNTYVVAFEDRLNGDFDYNDLVLTASIVPVPPAMALIALGMGGVAVMRARRRKS